MPGDAERWLLAYGLQAQGRPPNSVVTWKEVLDNLVDSAIQKYRNSEERTRPARRKLDAHHQRLVKDILRKLVKKDKHLGQHYNDARFSSAYATLKLLFTRAKSKFFRVEDEHSARTRRRHRSRRSSTDEASSEDKPRSSKKLKRKPMKRQHSSEESDEDSDSPEEEPRPSKKLKRKPIKRRHSSEEFDEDGDSRDEEPRSSKAKGGSKRNRSTSGSDSGAPDRKQTRVEQKQRVDSLPCDVQPTDVDARSALPKHTTGYSPHTSKSESPFELQGQQGQSNRHDQTKEHSEKLHKAFLHAKSTHNERRALDRQVLEAKPSSTPGQHRGTREASSIQSRRTHRRQQRSKNTSKPDARPEQPTHGHASGNDIPPDYDGDRSARERHLAQVQSETASSAIGNQPWDGPLHRSFPHDSDHQAIQTTRDGRLPSVGPLGPLYPVASGGLDGLRIRLVYMQTTGQVETTWRTLDASRIMQNPADALHALHDEIVEHFRPRNVDQSALQNRCYRLTGRFTPHDMQSTQLYTGEDVVGWLLELHACHRGAFIAGDLSIEGVGVSRQSVVSHSHGPPDGRDSGQARESRHLEAVDLVEDPGSVACGLVERPEQQEPDDGATIHPAPNRPTDKLDDTLSKADDQLGFTPSHCSDPKANAHPDGDNNGNRSSDEDEGASSRSEADSDSEFRPAEEEEDDDYEDDDCEDHKYEDDEYEDDGVESAHNVVGSSVDASDRVRDKDDAPRREESAVDQPPAELTPEPELQAETDDTIIGDPNRQVDAEGQINEEVLFETPAATRITTDEIIEFCRLFDKKSFKNTDFALPCPLPGIKEERSMYGHQLFLSFILRRDRALNKNAGITIGHEPGVGKTAPVIGTCTLEHVLGSLQSQVEMAWESGYLDGHLPREPDAERGHARCRNSRSAGLPCYCVEANRWFYGNLQPTAMHLIICPLTVLHAWHEEFVAMVDNNAVERITGSRMEFLFGHGSAQSTSRFFQNNVASLPRRATVHEWQVANPEFEGDAKEFSFHLACDRLRKALNEPPVPDVRHIGSSRTIVVTTIASLKNQVVRYLTWNPCPVISIDWPCNKADRCKNGPSCKVRGSHTWTASDALSPTRYALTFSTLYYDEAHLNSKQTATDATVGEVLEQSAARHPRGLKPSLTPITGTAFAGNPLYPPRWFVRQRTGCWDEHKLLGRWTEEYVEDLQKMYDVYEAAWKAKAWSDPNLLSTFGVSPKVQPERARKLIRTAYKTHVQSPLEEFVRHFTMRLRNSSQIDGVPLVFNLPELRREKVRYKVPSRFEQGVARVVDHMFRKSIAWRDAGIATRDAMSQSFRGRPTPAELPASTEPAEDAGSDVDDEDDGQGSNLQRQFERGARRSTAVLAIPALAPIIEQNPRCIYSTTIKKNGWYANPTLSPFWNHRQELLRSSPVMQDVIRRIEKRAKKKTVRKCPVPGKWNQTQVVEIEHYEKVGIATHEPVIVYCMWMILQDRLSARYGSKVSERVRALYDGRQSEALVHGVQLKPDLLRMDKEHGSSRGTGKGSKDATDYMPESIDVLVFNTKIGGHGLTLTAIDTVMIVGADPELSRSEQVPLRSYRNTQTKPVTVIQYMCEYGGIDANIIRVREAQGTLLDAILESRAGREEISGAGDEANAALPSAGSTTMGGSTGKSALGGSIEDAVFIDG